MEAYSSAANDVYHWACTPDFSDINTHQKMDVLLKIATDGTVPIVPGVYSLNTEIGRLYSQQDNGSIFSGSFAVTDSIYLNTTLTVLASSCLLQTPRNIAIAWPTLTPSVIKNNAAESKVANIVVGCEDNNSHPMTVTVTGSEGNESVANGIVKTSTKDLGLQLSWVNNGQPIPLSQPMDINPGAAGNLTQDFSIAAKPVATGNGHISAGDFSSNVTVTFEYH
jgi:type 1 fimbria pilin